MTSRVHRIAYSDELLFFLFVFLFSGLSVFGQRSEIDVDIFGNLNYKSRDGKYTATLEKNIFDDLIYKDSRRNQITFEKKYLDKEYRGIIGNKEQQRKLFLNLVRENRRDENYKASYKIDIFDKLIIEDNRGYKLEEGKDIFGHNNIEEQRNGVKSSLKRNIHGYLEFQEGRDNASLKKDIFDKWTYEDSFGNKVQLAPKTWDRMIRRFRTDEAILQFFVDQFFF